MLEQRLEKIIEPVLSDHDARLVKVEFKSNTLTVMVEGKDGSRMGVDDFAKISQDLSPVLEVEDPIDGAYRLEVSSPGIDRPLVTEQDFIRFEGFEAKIELKIPQNGQKRFRGWLKEYKEGTNILETEDKGTFELPHADIAKAKLVLTDKLIEFTKDKN